MNTSSVAASQRLLSLPDKHRALLAEFDYFPQYDLLRVRWHGHITAEAIVQGAEAGLALFKGNTLPQRLLSDNSQVSGEWEEAVPWLHYEWLPQAEARGLQLFAHIFSFETEAPLEKVPGGPELLEAMQARLLVRSFRSPGAAWQWATTR